MKINYDELCTKQCTLTVRCHGLLSINSVMSVRDTHQVVRNTVESYVLFVLQPDKLMYVPSDKTARGIVKRIVPKDIFV